MHWKATNFVINRVSCHKHACHVATNFVNTLWLLPCCRQHNGVNSLYCKLNLRFAFWLVIYEHTWQLVFNTRSGCVFARFTCCVVDVFMHFLSCPALLTWQFEPTTLACEDMATHFYIRTGCQLPHYMFVHCSMCPFLFLVSFALTWQLQHLLNCLMNCRFLMKPMCLVATFIVGQS